MIVLMSLVNSVKYIQHHNIHDLEKKLIGMDKVCAFMRHVARYETVF